MVTNMESFPARAFYMKHIATHHEIRYIIYGKISLQNCNLNTAKIVNVSNFIVINSFCSYNVMRSPDTRKSMNYRVNPLILWNARNKLI